MSIPLAAETLLPPPVLVGLLIVSAIAVSIARAAGVFRPRGQPVLRTLYSPEPAMPLLLNIIMALGVFVVASFVMGRIVHAAPAAPDAAADLPPDTLVLLNVVIPTAVFVSLAVGLATFVPRGLDRLGLTRSPLRAGAFAASMLLVVLPMLFLVLGVAEYVYQAVGYEHEPAHELLTAMDPKKPLVKYGAILAAVVVAPVFEEFLFRGHLQTLLRRMFSTRSAPVPELTPIASEQAELARPPHVLEYGHEQRSTFWPSFLAVVLTSLLFASVHPLWSAPAIFVLSLALGFVYERTANLWAPIILHALFNGLMTTMFLLQN